MEMIILSILLFMSIFLVILTIYQKDILKTLKEIKGQKEKACTTIRKHTNIEQSNYTGVLNARGDKKGYEVFKNENGLYEPVRPHQGIKIEKKEE